MKEAAEVAIIDEFGLSNQCLDTIAESKLSGETRKSSPFCAIATAAT